MQFDTIMTEVKFVEVKPFVSCNKDLEASYHIPSSIATSSKHYIALCEVGECSQFTWVWAGKIVPLEEEKNGITVQWRKGKVTFRSHVLPKLSDGREYFLMYCNEDGTILGESGPFQFCTGSEEFSSIDLQSAPSEDAVMVSMHRKNPPSTSSSEISLHSNNGSVSFEVLSEQRYSDITELIAGDIEKQEPEYFNQSSVPKGDNNAESTTIELPLEGIDTKVDELPSTRTNNYQNTTMESRLHSLIEKVTRLTDEVTMKNNIIQELQIENLTLKEQIVSNSLSKSTVLVTSPKEDKEKKILKKRIQDETKKSSRLEELLNHKETRILQLEKDITRLSAELTRSTEVYNQLVIEKLEAEQQLETSHTENKRLIDEVQYLQTGASLAEKLQNSGPIDAKKMTKQEVDDHNLPVGADYKTKLYIKLFKQDPFVCHICNEVLPAHTQEFTRLNHVQHCKSAI